MTMERKYLSVVLCAILVTACSESNDDLRVWMTQEENQMTGRVEPIPPLKPHTIAEYEVAGLSVPFDPSRVAPQSVESTAGGPPVDHVPEPLEAFPLSSLTMVGVLRQEDTARALIRAGNSLYQVSVGQYMGQDYGKVTEIDDSKITLEEWITSPDDEWVTRTNTLILQER